MMKRKILAGALALALSLGLAAPALAAEADVAARFPAVNSYPGFADVKDGDWYAGTVKLCYEVGLMKGTDDGFQPNKGMTVAEAAVIAARMGDILDGGDGVIENPAGAEHWYTGAMTYMHQKAHFAGNETAKEMMSFPDEGASRHFFLMLLALVATEDLLSPINHIEALPDIQDPDVLAFYNAGILTGVNDYGTFQGRGGLSRAECAAMAARLARPELRVSFTPAAADLEDPSFDFASYVTGYAGETPYLAGEGNIVVTLGEFADEAVKVSTELFTECLEQGIEFDWSNTIGGKPFTEYVTLHTQYNTMERAWRNSSAAPVADEAGRAAWEAEKGMMKAKHILVEDEATANELYAQLQADPDQFDLLLLAHGTDPGMEENPDGYVFGPGFMVKEFEDGTKALQPGETGAPVKSEFGWHIIQRLPVTLEDYQEELYTTGWPAFLAEPDQNKVDVLLSINIDVFFNGFMRLAGA